MAGGNKRLHKRRRKTVQRKVSTGVAKGSIIRSSVIHYKHVPTQREIDLQKPNTWYYRTPLTVNNRYTPTPLRVHEPGLGLVDWQSKK
jgi:hypothetical protein